MIWRGITIEDPLGDAWLADALRRYQTNPKGYVDRPLPVYTSPVPLSVPIRGRFVFDRATGILHDVTRATVACGIDTLAQPSWIHFAAELEGAIGTHAARAAALGTPIPPVTACGHCMAALDFGPQA